MALSRDFKKTVLVCDHADPNPNCPANEGIETLLAGDVDAGMAILRDYIKATVGF